MNHMNHMKIKPCYFVIFITSIIFWSGLSLQVSQTLCAQLPIRLPAGWRAHDLNRPTPPVVDTGLQELTVPPPSDAMVLFDGKDLKHWQSENGEESRWQIVEGVLESVRGAGQIVTKQAFGDCQIHLEWSSPVKVQGSGQGRGNSGVFLRGKYEIQILDSFENPTYADGSAGSVYGQYPPLVNASRPPGVWQSYDIIFRAPRFDDQGKRTEQATVTVLHNGVLIQNHSKIIGPTNWIQFDEDRHGQTTGPIKLQDHGNPVRFRNIWVREITDLTEKAEKYPSEAQEMALSADSMQKFTGDYDGFAVRQAEDKLYLQHLGRKLEMMPVNETEFEFRFSAGRIEFELDENGNVIAAVVSLDAAGSRRGQKKRE